MKEEVDAHARKEAEERGMVVTPIPRVSARVSDYIEEISQQEIDRWRRGLMERQAVKDTRVVKKKKRPRKWLSCRFCS